MDVSILKLTGSLINGPDKRVDLDRAEALANSISAVLDLKGSSWVMVVDLAPCLRLDTQKFELPALSLEISRIFFEAGLPSLIMGSVLEGARTDHVLKSTLNALGRSIDTMACFGDQVGLANQFIVDLQIKIEKSFELSMDWILCLCDNGLTQDFKSTLNTLGPLACERFTLVNAGLDEPLDYFFNRIQTSIKEAREKL